MNILKSLLLFFLINTPYVAAQEVTIVNNSGERVILIAPDDSPSYLKYFSAKCQRIFFENKKMSMSYKAAMFLKQIKF